MRTCGHSRPPRDVSRSPSHEMRPRRRRTLRCARIRINNCTRATRHRSARVRVRHHLAPHAVAAQAWQRRDGHSPWTRRRRWLPVPMRAFAQSVAAHGKERDTAVHHRRQDDEQDTGDLHQPLKSPPSSARAAGKPLEDRPASRPEAITYLEAFGRRPFSGLCSNGEGPMPAIASATASRTTRASSSRSGGSEKTRVSSVVSWAVIAWRKDAAKASCAASRAIVFTLTGTTELSHVGWLGHSHRWIDRSGFDFGRVQFQFAVAALERRWRRRLSVDTTQVSTGPDACLCSIRGGA